MSSDVRRRCSPRSLLAAALLGLTPLAGYAFDVPTDRAVNSPLPPERIDLFAGDSRVLDVRARRIVVGNGKIVSATLLERGEVLLIGEAPGTTVLSLWSAGQRERRVLVTVSEFHAPSVLETIRELLVGVDGVSARIAGSRVVLGGEGVTEAAQARAAAIAAMYAGLVVNFVGKAGWEPMVHIGVRIVEVRRSALRDVGVRWRPIVAGPKGVVVADLVTNGSFTARGDVGSELIGSLPERVWPPKLFAGLATTFDSELRLLEQRGDASILAEPTLSCRSGGSARFVAGGEVPIPITDGLGSPNVQFRDYGIILDVQPVASRDGAIYARIDTQVSQIDPSVQVLGVPGLLKRQSRADVNLREGETLVVAGLVSRIERNARDRLPGVGAIPGVGRLFGSRSRGRDDTELVVLMTPRIVRGFVDADRVAIDPQARDREFATSAERDRGR